MGDWTKSLYSKDLRECSLCGVTLAPRALQPGAEPGTVVCLNVSWCEAHRARRAAATATKRRLGP